MTQRLGSLQAIRDKIAKQNEKPLDHCPSCGHGLTIEKTIFFESRICENCFEFSEIKEASDCCRDRSVHKVKMAISGGGIQVREQCTSCGWLSANSLPSTGADRDKMPFADLALKADNFDKVWLLKREVNIRVADGRAAHVREDRMRQYSQYLNSPEWRAKRDLVLKRDNYRCQACLNALATQVHHKSYEFVDLAGSEPAFDLVSICTPCHEKIEQMKNDRRNSK